MNTIKKIFILLTLILSCVGAAAQWEEPVTVNVKQEKKGEKEIVLTFHLSIDPGWHVYSTDVGAGGPTPASFHVDEAKGIRAKGGLQPVGHAVKKMDPVFNMEVSFFEGTATFRQVLEITGKEYSLKGYMEYGACNDHSCLPPTSVDVEVKGERAGEASQEELVVATEETNQDEDQADTAVSASAEELSTFDPAHVLGKETDSALWSSKTKELQALDKAQGANASSMSGTHGNSLWWIFIMGVLGGLIAVITPCVWPIIPMTVSFFLKRAEKQAKTDADNAPADADNAPAQNKKGAPLRTNKGVRDALLYGASIVVIYVGLGLLITLLFGASALNSLSTNAIVNIFFCLLLVVFGLSFFGFFELELPSSWSNKADKKAASTTGLLSIFIMAFTLALVSFSCTGPIVGFLLVEVSTMGNIIGPLIGMLGFALALALPFTLFALFPQWMKKVKRGGSWMNSVKVILGFVEIAFSLKFLSVADMAYGWHILPREVFIAIWILLAVMLGLYLLGVLRLPIDGPRDKAATGIRRIFQHRRHWEIALGVVSLLFGAYMVPGFLGKPLPAISAFTPPMYTQRIHILKDNNVEANFRDYEEGMAYARKTGKRVLIDFTGFGCVNCREMEQTVWNNPEVAAKLKKDYILISLFVDDREPLPKHIKVKERGKVYTLRTIGDKWSYLQRHRFGANAQPFYVITSPEGEPLKPAYGFNTNIKDFLDFLE